MKQKLSSAALNIILVVCSIIVVLPFVWMLSSSFKTNAEINARVQSFFPRAFTLQNYIDVLEKFKFVRYFINSLIYVTLVTLVTIYTSTLSGFVFSKYKFKGRQLLFTCILLTMMVPGVVTIIPRYSIMQSFGWIDTYASLIVPAAFTSFGIFLMRQACYLIPNEMLEAARIDGANEFYTFHRIVFPQLRNSVITIAIFQFLFAWDDYLWPYLMIRTPEKQMLSVALSIFNGRYSTDYAGLFAATSIAIIPVVVFYVFFQKRFIKGVSSASIKG